MDGVGISDPLLNGITLSQQNQLLCGFAESVRRNQSGKSKRTVLRVLTVRAAIGSVCATFRQHFRDDPSLDKAGRPLLTLKRQLQAYTNEDPPEKHQKALPIRVLKALARNNTSERNTAIFELITGVFFFAMRSCEYLQVRSSGKTKRLTCSEI